ncbi:unnamed protein product [Penicillium salamii]|uniref:Uncharacterized protein n=1 Tax=Penicillium salamii TaxID=1612424 RepID=A0A9W4JEN5_9EURO|nr:unnamed protein product [Penicillium salamii]CAG8073523.1 unnamed protein product [Penicillium salamii]CAG8121034.1 unnamed protein product [Penicillium salamii]CAG8134136.1 unnamed protein product [Penicillium salamii]CAG8300977.1 unnamed protein product [Penicillium salamii]
MDQEEAPPPPYSAVDPLLTPANNRNNDTSPTSAPLQASGSSQDASSSRAPVHPTVLPSHFTSAAAYFEQRPPSVVDEGRSLLQHHMTVYPRSQAKDFPRRPRCWASRFDETTQQDWDTFLRYLFPPELGLAASSQHLPRQLRAEIRRDRKDRPQETDEQRRARISAVVGEWNECFFHFRGAHIVFVYVGEPDSAPPSALCPRCYPAATGSIESSPSRHPNTPSPVPSQHNPSPTPWPVSPSPYHHPQAYAHPLPYGAPYGAPLYPSPVSPNQPPQYYPHPQPQRAWQWNNWGHAPQQQPYPSNGSSKGGWISQLASTAQKYGERFSEQAQQYGDQISAQAQHYGRQVEEQALAHGRWIEEQARLHGRKEPMATPYSSNYYGRPAWDNSPRPLPTATVPGNPVQAPSPVAPVPPHTTSPPEAPNQDSSKPKHLVEQPPSELAPSERSRRVSVSSVSSESSFSSIDSISTTSDLDVSDLATVRTQLELLDDRHDRTLYDAVVGLRQQLTVLQKTRREARFLGKDNWKAGFGQSQLNKQEAASNDWGRWESPEQQQRNSVDRRAMKDEMRTTKKAFRDALRRAREEQRERRRANRRQVRQARAGDVQKVNKTHDQPLGQQLSSLRLDDSQSNQAPAPRPSTSIQSSPVDSYGSNVGFAFASNPPSTTQANTQELASGGSTSSKKSKPAETTSRLKDILKSKKVKKQKEDDAGNK